MIPLLLRCFSLHESRLLDDLLTSVAMPESGDCWTHWQWRYEMQDLLVRRYPPMRLPRSCYRVLAVFVLIDLQYDLMRLVLPFWFLYFSSEERCVRNMLKG